MDHISKYLTPEIKLSCYDDKFFKSEIVFDQHMLIWFISGETKIIQAEASYVFKTGDIFLIPRNKPATVINYSKDGLPHKTVVMLLTTKILKDFYSRMEVKVKSTPIPGIRSYSNHPLLKSCLASLIPYFEVEGKFPEDLALLKIAEALSILRTIDPSIDSVLANFEDPHKVELVSFMEKNYMFNMPLEKFGYLTGRSLTSFKRDFKKAFNSTPQKWLTQKRLELAHYELAEKKRRPIEVCYEIGFEKLSHFSYAFKKHFGYAPTKPDLIRMPAKFEYTTLAHRYTARFPLITYVGTQVNFWILANILLVIMVHLYGRIISEMHSIRMDGDLGTFVLVAVIMGFVYGLGLGLTTYYLEQKFFRKLSSGKVLLYKTLLSLALLLLVLTFLRFALFDLLVSPTFNMTGIVFSERSWDYLFLLFLMYYFSMNLMISFINQVNKKYGPGVLVPLLLGRYRTPREEERIFMFMDLKSSTLTAERLGHLKYSAFIRDCFADINEVLYPFCAQVYQYVGDEIVITWPEAEGLRNNFCIRFYFAVKEKFVERASYYETSYGLLPVFKAGLHTGKVTAVEIGEVKKDIAYHGDTLNTAARIQSVCNEFQKDFLASEHLINKVAVQSNLKTEHLGSVLLRGKAEQIRIVSVVEQ